MNLLKLVKPTSYKNMFSNTNRYGSDYVKHMIKHRSAPQYILYNNWYNQIKPDEKALAEQRKKVFDYKPLISIVVPVFNPPVNFLKEMLDSVFCQTYDNWELCIANASVGNEEIKRVLDDYSQDDKRIKLVHLEENLGISGNSNKALDLVKGDYVALLDHDDVLPHQALFEVVSALQETQHDLLYSDEDFISYNLKIKHSPQFKPDWSPHLLECHNYITHFLVVKKTFLDKVGYFKSKYDGAQDYDFVLRCTEKTKDIYHIPKVLYHWRVHQGSVAGDSDSKKYAYDAGKQALIDHFIRTGVDAKVDQANLTGYYHPIYSTHNNPLVSIVIPNKDHVDDLKKCIKSLYDVNTYENIEIIIAENNSEEKQTFEYYEELKSKHSNIKVTEYKAEFNYSAINNFAIKSSTGEYLLFLNNDTELITPDGIAQMLGCCMLSNVGIVGAKLLYEDDTVQHAGAVLGFGGFAGHVFNGIGKDDPGYANKACLSYDCSVVTAACMMISRKDFDAIDGFSEDYKVAINDVDLCMKSNATGKYTVCDCFALWYHYESKSRGSDEESKETKQRFLNEKTLFQKRWGDAIEKGDPFYNSNFILGCAPYSQRLLRNLACKIDYCKIRSALNNKFKIKLQGWAISELGNSVSINLYINDKLQTDSITRKKRNDLYNCSISQRLNNADGFACKMSISESDVVKIVFKAQKEVKTYTYSYKALKKLSKKIKEDLEKIYKEENLYDAWYHKNKPTKQELQNQENTKFEINPKFSIVIPLYRTPKKFLSLLIESLKNQTYKNWEVCFSDGSGDKEDLEAFVKKFSEKDQRIKYTKSDKQLHISDNTNLALSIASGDYIVFGDHDDLFEPNALFECVKLINEDPSVDMIYTDEDKIDMDGSEHYNPHFKPDFNLDMLRSENYICHMCVVSRNLYNKVGNLKSEYDGAQDFDYVLRCSEKTNNIRHIPKVLYSWRAHRKSTAGNPESKKYAYLAGAKAVQHHLDRQGIKALVKLSKFNGVYKSEYFVEGNPLISVIIPNRDSVDKLKRCLDSLFNVNKYKNVEILVIENGSREKKTFEYYDSIKQNPKVNIIQYKKEDFNFADICNYAVSFAKGKYVLFLHNDTEIIKPKSVKEMLMHCNRKEIGAVGAKMFFEEDTVQHAGITIGLNGLFGYNFEGLNKEEHGYVSRAKIVHDVSAVSSACMMTKKSLFEEINGFDTDFKEEFCDVDYCLRLQEKGLLTVFTPYAQLMHYKRRYIPYEPSMKDSRKNSELLFKNRWSKIVKNGDPYYNPNLTKEKNDFSLMLTN